MNKKVMESIKKEIVDFLKHKNEATSMEIKEDMSLRGIGKADTSKALNELVKYKTVIQEYDEDGHPLNSYSLYKGLNR